MSHPDALSTPVGEAVVFRTITLHEGVTTDDFELFMLQELFPTVPQTAGPGETPDQHSLLNNGNDTYVWTSRLAYEIHQTPLPGWLINRVDQMNENTREKIERFGTTSSELFYDVAPWRKRIGK